jgi:hypothetical protein
MSGATSLYLPLFFHGILRGYIASTVDKCLLNLRGAFKYKVKFLCFVYLMFVDPCIIVQFINKNTTICNNVSKVYYSIFI